MATCCTGGTFEKRAAMSSFSVTIGVSLNTDIQAAPAAAATQAATATPARTFRRLLFGGGALRGAGGPPDFDGGTPVPFPKANVPWHRGHVTLAGPVGTAALSTAP